MVGLGQLTKLCVFWAVLIDPALALASEDAPRGALAETAIPAQPLAQALSAFSSSTHLQLVYVSQLALGKESQDLPAGLPAATALQHLLEGTGVDFLFLNDHTVKLFEQPRAPRPPAARPGRDAAGGDTPAAEPLDEVVVSATKRAEILDTVPMSISVLSPEDIEASGMQSIAGIAAVTTSVEYDYSSQYGPGILTNLAIRGISADKGDATTGIYIDDTPIQAPHTTFGNPYPLTFDMAQVEVLKGPQGVLFGRGAEGGAVRFVTNEPSTTTMSQLYRTEVSSTDDGGASVELGAAAGGPLVDGLVGARVSAWYREDGGYINHIDPFTGAVTDPDSNRSAARAFRIAVAYEPNEALRLTPSFSHQSVNLHDSPVFYDAPPQPGPLDNGKLLRQPAVDDLNLASITRDGSTGLREPDLHFVLCGSHGGGHGRHHQCGGHRVLRRLRRSPRSGIPDLVRGRDSDATDAETGADLRRGASHVGRFAGTSQVAGGILLFEAAPELDPGYVCDHGAHDSGGAHRRVQHHHGNLGVRSGAMVLQLVLARRRGAARGHPREQLHLACRRPRRRRLGSLRRKQSSQRARAHPALRSVLPARQSRFVLCGHRQRVPRGRRGGAAGALRRHRGPGDLSARHRVELRVGCQEPAV